MLCIRYRFDITKEYIVGHIHLVSSISNGPSIAKMFQVVSTNLWMVAEVALRNQEQVFAQMLKKIL